MIDIRKVRSLAVPGDSILSGSRKFFSLSNLIQVGQTPQTGNKRPSLFSDERKYYDFITVVESTIDFNPYNPMNRKRMQSGVQRNRLDTIVGDEDTYGYLIRYKALKQKDFCAIKDAPDYEAYANWFDPKNRVGLSHSFNRTLADYLRMIRRTPLSLTQRLACYRIVGRWFLLCWRGIAGEWKRTIYHYCGIRLKPRRGKELPA